MTPMTLGAVYLGGAYFFVRAFRAAAWHTVKSGFVAVGTFASLMGVATILHWDRFNHDHVAFWLWGGLYFTTPFLVWGVWAANRGRDTAPDRTTSLLPPAARTVMGGTGVGRRGRRPVPLPPAVTGRSTCWPWTITPLTSRVLGRQSSCWASPGSGCVADARWRAARIMLQVQVFMLTLILLAAARAHGELRRVERHDLAPPRGFVAAVRSAPSCRSPWTVGGRRLTPVSPCLR